MYLFEPSTSRRKSFSKDLKSELHASQSGRCMYCGRKPGIDLMDIDHKNPIAKGGSNTKRNLQLLCRSCNTRKGATTDRQFRSKFKSIGVPQTQTPPAKSNCSRLRGRVGLQSKFRAWPPVHNQSEKPKIPSSLNSYGKDSFAEQF